MKQCKIFTALSAVCLLSLVSIAQRADASFSVEDDSANLPTYGHARNPVFEETISGESELTEKDKMFLNEVNRQNPKFEGYYAQLLLGLSDTRLNSFSTSSNDAIYVHTKTPKENEKVGANSLAISLGMKAGSWGFELEVGSSETARDELTFTEFPISVANVVTTDNTVVAQISVQQVAGFLNGFYYLEIPQWSSFHPYVMAGLGATRVLANLEMRQQDQSQQVVKDTRTNASWQAGVGLKYQFFQWLIADLHARYSSRGKAIFGPVYTDLDANPAVAGFVFRSRHIYNSGVYLGVAVPLG